MKRNNLIAFVIVLASFFCSCERKVKEYYTSGEVSEIKFIKRNAEHPYLIEKFSKNGKMIGNLNFDPDGNLDGSSFELLENGDSVKSYYSKNGKYLYEQLFEDNGDIYYTHFWDGLEHGIGWYFNKNKSKSRGISYKGKLIAFEEFKVLNLGQMINITSIEIGTNNAISKVIKNDSFDYAVTSHRISGDNTKFYPVGTYFLKTGTNDIENSYSTYIIINVSDTLNSSDSIHVTVAGYNSDFKDFYFELELSDIDSINVLSGLKRNNMKFISDSLTNKINLTLPPQAPGYHFLLGSAFLRNHCGTYNQQFIVFDDFYVKEKVNSQSPLHYTY